MNYWLMKSEPGCYSIDDLQKDKTTHWDGVRNYQARNFMRDDMRVGDRVFFYHSNAKPPGIAGTAEICRESYPDFTAWDKKNDHFDPKTDKDNPRWFMVDLKFLKKFDELISLNEIKDDPRLEGILVAQKGQRLSVQPVSAKHAHYLESLRD